MFNDMKFRMPKTAVAAYNKRPANPGWSTLDTELKIADKTIATIENDKVWQTSMRNYFGMVKLIDDKIGDLLRLLRKRGEDENTIIVFTSDHGDLMAEHGNYNKGKPYKTSIGVPFIVRWPARIRKRKIVKTAYSSPDFAPTILSLMGIDHGVVNYQGIDGSDELLNNEIWSNREQIRFSSDSKHANWAAAVDRHYKLVFGRSGPPILFDLEEDPDELYNYIADEKYKNITETLTTALVTAMIKNKFSLAKNKSIFLTTPACYDTKDQLANLPNRVCADLRTQRYEKKCSIDEVGNLCPNTCGICCEDTVGEIRFKKIFVTCAKAKAKKSLCKERPIQIFCPVTCSQCIPKPSSSPSALPSLSPSSNPTTSSVPTMSPSAEPSNAPTSKPSSTPSESPTDMPSTSPSVAPSSNPTFEPSLVPSKSPSGTPSYTPTNKPTSTPSLIPSSSPSMIPSRSNCIDDAMVQIDKHDRECIWLKKDPSRLKKCNRIKVREACPHSCGICCMDDAEYTFETRLRGIFRTRDCDWVKEKGGNLEKLCNGSILSSSNGQLVKEGCPLACNKCNDNYLDSI